LERIVHGEEYSQPQQRDINPHEMTGSFHFLLAPFAKKKNIRKEENFIISIFFPYVSR